MTELENIKLFFTERRSRCLSVRMIEREAGVPDKTLDHFLKGRRVLNPIQLDKLIPVLVDFGYKPINSDEKFL